MKRRLLDNGDKFVLSEDAGPLTHLAIGLLLGFPPCCVMRFALDHVLGFHDSAKRRGDIDGRYVPCGIFHRGEPWSEPVEPSLDEEIAEAEQAVAVAAEHLDGLRKGLAGLQARKDISALLGKTVALIEQWERLSNADQLPDPLSSPLVR